MSDEIRRNEFTSLSGRQVKSVYTAADLDGFNPATDLGAPGEFPYTRGIHPDMYRGRQWTMRLFAGFGSAVETNQRYKFLLERGQTGLSVAFDMPTIMGYDSDHPLSRGEVGRCGVAICTLDDMETLFDGIPMDKVTTSMTINGPASILLSLYAAVAKRQGVPLDKIGGTIQNDILKEYMAQNSWIFPPEPSLRLITDIFAHCADEIPRWNTISISGYHIREAGSTAQQELAFTLMNGLFYAQRGVEAGLDIDSFAPRLSFFFDAHIDFFEEIAKFRAARRIWARELKKRFNASDPRSLKLRFHTQTAGVSLTAEEPENNIIRTAFEALSAVLGGTQSLHTNSMDEVLALPTEKSAQIALRTQQILALETEVANTADPLAGSYFVESLTNDMEAAFYDYDEKVRKLGGPLKALDQAFFQKEIADASFRYQRALEEKRKYQVGVTVYNINRPPDIELLKIDQATEDRQVERVRKFKSKRDSAAAANAVAELKRAAASNDENLIPLIIGAVESHATMGEIIQGLKEVFGSYKERLFL
ncbi:MAG: Methylmalonyl-CoA mutase [bacterium ADurb.Bin236]|mgnify:CR=1 FL=1|nr:MAG: Methylmalonyl-CoA mutase [bacterium ADurb.Bin236]HPN93628.1 methylmalonyl-CoA mutase family protein [bacterium]